MSGKRWLAVLFPLIAAIADRIIKWHSFAALPPGGAVVLLPGVEYRLYLNTGLAFSLFTNTIALIAWALAALALIIWLVIKTKNEPTWIFAPVNLCAVTVIALGGASNLYDRIAAHGVIDYIILFSRSAINIADIMILAGVALLVFKRRSKGGLPANGA